MNEERERLAEMESVRIEDEGELRDGDRPLVFDRLIERAVRAIGWLERKAAR